MYSAGGMASCLLSTQLGRIFIDFWDDNILMQVVHFWILEVLQLSALVFCESCHGLMHILYLKSLELER